ncbi:MAG: hypothetical protein KGR48_12845 [Alphaproteobacteria bacterium]|nr:hypothetical protein [Alphaproteobacteria bacterium]MBU6473480.1 hypothetical protein [Alphaproteobacteria bacterium]MDE2013979.1 hypothetical protein [Alphaproteobacteria bacterium]MDE2074289.1 hypothetical protein [Alphaproteobacteria bacterium]MDE2352184.1 hypothetical protein [Alphaproteobacteria bacterium]
MLAADPVSVAGFSGDRLTGHQLVEQTRSEVSHRKCREPAIVRGIAMTTSP